MASSLCEQELTIIGLDHRLTMNNAQIEAANSLSRDINEVCAMVPDGQVCAPPPS